MPKNKRKGTKNGNDNVKRELILEKDGQSYAQVTRILSNWSYRSILLRLYRRKKNDYVTLVVNYVRKCGLVKETIILIILGD